jgi:NitT/TauT family transport system permease protein
MQWVNPFITSSPSRIIKTIGDLYENGSLFYHISTTLWETLAGFFIAVVVGYGVALALWWSEAFRRVAEPYLVVLNALPKTALAPIMIIWAGTGLSGIVVVAISILLIITVLSTYNFFINVDEEKIKMMKSFSASKLQIFTKLVFPSNIRNIASIIKINIGMSWVGVIVGEFLVSKEGLGYLIMYGGQVFKLDLVMMGVLVLAICAFLMNVLVEWIEKIILKGRD